MAKNNKIALIDPRLADVWSITRIIKFTYGLGLGLFQYTYQVFLYDHFGADVSALKRVVFLIIVTSFIVIVSDVPTGALGDYLGRKKTVVLCFAVGAIALFFRTWIFFIHSISLSFVVAIFAAIFNAVSYSLLSGNFAAWIVDTVRERKVEGGYGPIVARSYSIMISAKVVGAAISLWLYLQGYVYYAFGLGCISYVLCALYCATSMKETESLRFFEGKIIAKQTLQRLKEIIVEGFRIIRGNKPVAYLVVMFAAFMLLIHIVLYLWPISMKSNFGVEKMSFFWFVVVFASFVTSFGGAKLLELLSRRHVRRWHIKVPGKTLWSWFAIVCLTTAVPIVTLGFCSYTQSLSLPVFIGAMAIFNVGYGFLMPAHDTLINYYIPENHSKERATVMSFSTMLVNLMMVLFMFPSSGSSGKATAVGWTLPALILILSTLIINSLMRRYERREAASSACNSAAVAGAGS